MASRQRRPRAERGYDDRVDDRAVVSWQLGRPARAFRRVAVRCPYGFPAVTEQAPFGTDGEPFPTTYYLTCPWLVAAIARLEAAGGVERWSRGRGRRSRAAARAWRAPTRAAASSGRSSTSASRARARPATSSACTPTPPSRSRGPATSSASASSPRSASAGAPTRAARARRGGGGAVMLDSARHQWDEGMRRLEAVGAETARGRHLWLLVEAVLGRAPAPGRPDVHARRARPRVRGLRGLGPRRRPSARPRRGPGGDPRRRARPGRGLRPLRPRGNRLPSVTVGGDPGAARARERGRKRAPSSGPADRRLDPAPGLVGAVFFAGLAVGRALEEAPEPGRHADARPHARAADGRASRADRHGYDLRALKPRVLAARPGEES